MVDPQFNKEMKAYAAFQRAVSAAQEAAVLFESAGIPLPPPLARMLGHVENGHPKDHRPRLSVTPLDSPNRPNEAGTDWIWVPDAEATPTVLLLAILREAGGVVPQKDAIRKLETLKKGVNPGSIYNLVARLGANVIEKTDEGWRLLNPNEGALLSKGELWGPPDVFGKYELAIHRRMAIMHLLEAVPGGPTDCADRQSA